MGRLPNISSSAIQRIHAFSREKDNLDSLGELVEHEIGLLREEMEVAVRSANFHAVTLLQGRIEASRDLFSAIRSLAAPPKGTPHD
jgi:hypothetical protein